MIDCTCPKCGEHMSVPSSLAGQIENCPSCDTTFTVPKPRKAKTIKPPELASDRQKAYATSLAISYPSDITVREMSLLIDHELKRREAADDAESVFSDGPELDPQSAPAPKVTSAPTKGHATAEVPGVRAAVVATCPVCGGNMYKHTPFFSFVGCLGVVVFFAGVGLLCVYWPVGLVLCVLGLICGSIGCLSKVWRCSGCKQRLPV